jgi:hypothetical protein
MADKELDDAAKMRHAREAVGVCDNTNALKWTLKDRPYAPGEPDALLAADAAAA